MTVPDTWSAAATAGPSGQGRLPNLLIIGVTKAGTTSLFSYLAQHPDICASRRKETEYFSPLRTTPSSRLAPLDDYRRNFRHCQGQRFALEATPNYWYGAQQMVAAVERTLDDPHVVISLRDPVDRFWSEYRFMRSKGLLPHCLTSGRASGARTSPKGSAATGRCPPGATPTTSNRGGTRSARACVWCSSSSSGVRRNSWYGTSAPGSAWTPGLLTASTTAHEIQP
jgi:hypothetical protein